MTTIHYLGSSANKRPATLAIEKNILALMALAIVLSSPSVTKAQHELNVPRIGFLMPGAEFYSAPLIGAFRQGLREVGYIERKNIDVDYLYAEGKRERYVELANELVTRKVDIIVTSSTPAIQAVKNATKTIPVVMAAAADPVGTGLVASLAHPGSNITGLSMRSPEVSGKRLAIMKEIAPKTQRIGVLLTAGNAASENSLKDTQVAAQAMGFQLHSVKVHGPNDLERGFAELIRGRIEAFTVFRESSLLVHFKRLLTFASKHRLPTVYDGREFALAGGLMSYTPNHLDLYRRAASFVAKILKGAKPADLPVEQTMRAEFIINLEAANEIGLTIPPEVLQRADKVIQ